MRLVGAKIFDTLKGFVAGELNTAGDSIVSENCGETLSFDGCYLVPGFTDIHFHGCMGIDASDGGAEDIEHIAAYELSRGVTQICPALVATSAAAMVKACTAAAAHRGTQGAELVGINLEGPFISKDKCGAQNCSCVRPPDIAFFFELFRASGGLVKLVTVAPELSGAADFIAEASRVCRVSLGHTLADYDMASAAFAAGARQVTHLYNAMPPFLHRSPGVIGAAADDTRISAELISDGVHVHPSAVRAAFRLFGRDRVILVSDSIRAAGMGDGEYDLGGLPVTVRSGVAALADGTLAGSAVDLMTCFDRAIGFGIAPEDAVFAAAVNPAKALGIFDRYGSLEFGKAANILILNSDLKLVGVIMRGELQ